MSTKYLSLAALVVQNSALALVMRQSRTMNGPRYLSSTAVIVSELVKAALSFAILLSRSLSDRSDHADCQPRPTTTQVFRRTFADIRIELSRSNTLIPVIIPAILYTVQNNLQYLAATNLDAATFSVLYQGKILTTALFAVIFLRQKLNAHHWTGLLVLTCGIVLTSFPARMESLFDTKSVDDQVIGLLAVLSACLTSGFAGIFVEFLLKKANQGSDVGNTSQLWIRNVQLSAAGVAVACAVAVCVDGDKLVQQGFFYGYNHLVWTTILLQAIGGLIVSLVVTYADNILKGFATSLSLVASTLVSVVLGDCVLTQRFVLGVLMVLSATQIYILGPESKRAACAKLSQVTFNIDIESIENKLDWETNDHKGRTNDISIQDKRPALGARTKSAP